MAHASLPGQAAGVGGAPAASSAPGTAPPFNYRQEHASAYGSLSTEALRSVAEPDISRGVQLVPAAMKRALLEYGRPHHL